MAVSFRRCSVVSFLLLAFISLNSQTVAAADTPPEWAEHVSAHTAGLVSRKSEVHVLFTRDVVAPARVNQPAGEILRFNPVARGQARFVSTRELVWTPAADLAGGERYEATLQTAPLDGFPAHLSEYKFAFSVIRPDFEVTVGGLAPNPQKVGEFELAGTILTADREAPDQVERMLATQFQGRPMAAQWRHDEGGLRHDFTVGGIQRQSTAGMVNVTWDGTPIGVADDGQRMVEIPARRDFKLLDAQAVTGGGQYVQLRFSDDVDPRQNLSGLISLSIESSTRRVEGNIVKVYPSADTITGEVTLRVDGALRSTAGERIGAAPVERALAFSSQNPAVRFVGKGVILPGTKKLTIPFEAINAHSVQVTAFRVFSDNMGQFLQTNTLDGQRELDRVGRHLWRKTIQLPRGGKSDQWNRYALDATELLNKYPGALFRLTLSLNRGNARIACSEADAAVPVPSEAALKDAEDDNSREYSSWDYAEDWYGGGGNSQWRDRENPCKEAYYRYNNAVRQARNFIASNIGLLAKRDDLGRLNVVATDLRTAAPMPGVNLELRNYQNQRIGQAVTDAQGFAALRNDAQPFYLSATKGNEVGYLKLSQGSALPVSHFDVGGVKLNRGVNGYIYGERGVWRPGDNIYLTFVLQDKEGVIPDTHPVTMQLLDPQNQLVQSVTSNNPVGGFYTFTLKTREDAPTGNWTARALLGGATYTRSIPVETVVPNRLKIDLDFGGDTIRAGGEPLKAKLSAQWLHGAIADGLKADVSLRLESQPTRFHRYADFIFDDPARKLESERKTIFEGELDSDGKTEFEAEIEAENAPGMLDASFTSRVHEQGGAFSTNRKNVTLHPYARYVGIKLPKGDATRNMLLTDKDHIVEVATVDPDGKPVSAERVQVTLYKIDWKWWWDKSGDTLANYARGDVHNKLQEGTIATSEGRGQWKFQIKYPEWGRYLVRACDLDADHCTGQVTYIDWPGWAGRAVEQKGPGASMLTLYADKAKYQAGETAEIHLPDASRGRALFTVESASGILEQRWLVLDGKNNVVKLPLTRAMSPNVYASVTLVQPHQEKQNDLPIRLYGVIPIEVKDPQSELKPLVVSADEWSPRSLAKVKVSEQTGRAMTYTLAIVDEGLLGLTNFATPDLRAHFYKREALGISTWDLFDDVVGAYGGELERLLALGGSDVAAPDEESDAKRRFPPVVKFMGPFKLAAGKTNSHEFELPQYLGAVRVMVVAGERGAYGRAEKTVPVREAVSMLVTLPRVLRPTEEITVPVSLFVQNPGVRSAQVQVIADSMFEVLDGGKAEIAIQKPGEQLAFLRLRVKPQVGKGALRFTARAGTFRTESQVFIDVLNANPPVTKRERKVIAPGESWDLRVVPHGVEGTNRVNLEVTSIPPIDLDRRLRYLIQYPHGCVEQTTSSVFPQIYLPQMVQLSDKERQEIERNVNAGIERLRAFQGADGGFRYWPGAGGEVNPWANNYVGHFLLEASRLGYFVPKEMLDNWKLYQLKAARSFNTGASGHVVMEQAYRLYTLALARTPETSAMNRLYQSPTLQGVARWQLAAAYKLMSMATASDALIRDLKLQVVEYKDSDPTFGSALRDKAIILDSLLLLGRTDQAQALAQEIATDLGSESWYSTQSTAYGLFALSRMWGGAGPGNKINVEYALGSNTPLLVSSQKPIYSQVIPGFPLTGETVHVKNTSQGNLYATVTVEGVPPPGEEQATASGMGMEVSYVDMQGSPVDVERLPQGKEFIARVKVSNPGNREVKNLALTQVMPAGWEIHNARMEGASGRGLYDYQDVRDDRLLTYFGLKPNESKSFDVVMSSTYLGRYYLPGVAVEAMYDVTRAARSRGQWVEVVRK